MTGQISPSNHSASFSAVFGSQTNGTLASGAPWSPAPWSPQGLLAIMPPGTMPSPPAGVVPNGSFSVQGGLNTPHGALSTPVGYHQVSSNEIGCKASEVQRCDSKGQCHSDGSKNSHIQILSADIVDLRALASVYGAGLCPATLISPLHRAYSHKHCDCAGQPGHTTKNTKCHKMPRNGYGPRHQKSWDQVLAWKKKKSKSLKSKKKK